MRFIGGGEFLPLAGGTLTGPLTISANATPLLTINRPDGASHAAIRSAMAGTDNWELSCNAAEPHFAVSDPGVANRLTLRIDTGLLGTGLIPLSMLRTGFASAKNAGVVTVLSTLTDIAVLGTLNVTGSERIWVGASVKLTKGATTGITTLFTYQQAGTATIVWEDTYLDNGIKINLGANLEQGFPIFGIARVTGAGTLVLAVGGISAGSNSTVAINDGQISAEVLRA